MIASITAYRPTRRHLAIGAVVLVVLVGAGGVLYLINSSPPRVDARIDLRNAEHVHVNQPVPVKFDQPVDLSRVQVTLEPAAPMTVVKQKNRLLVQPDKTWEATKRYTIKLSDVPDSKHETKLRSWTASFFTQPRVGIGTIAVDGKPADLKAVQVTPRSKVQIAFTVSMKPGTVTFMTGDQPLPASNVQWQPDNQNVTLAVPVKSLYAPFTLSVGQNAISSYGDPFTDSAAATLTGVALEPVNTTSGIDANFQAQPPTMIVIENSDASRPQRGLQAADIVYEYVSEYNISRMTAIYFNKPPDLVGPVRSCRMINPYLGYAWAGYTMCSGASVGTLHYMFFDPHFVPGTINDFDQGNHFYRSGVDGKAGPHNLYTNGDRAVTLRQGWPLPQPNFQLDPPHPDIEQGDPADSPQVPLHHVGWGYDGGRKEYLRGDSGAAAFDASTGQQIHAKNVILLHVPFHDAGWVEDDNGGAHSVWYDMLGAGAAEIYSDGKLIRATWHMGASQGQWFYDNHSPVWFTDQSGNVVQLNSGLTWIHVLGNGQNS